MPQMGFFIEDLVSGISFCHMGATRRTYPEMAEIHGRLDILFLPIGRMSREEEIHALQLMAPKCVIPIAWRDAVDDYPIPKNGANSAETELLDFESPDDPVRHIDELTEAASKMGIQVTAIKAGAHYQA